MTILKSTNRGSEMVRVFNGLTNGYNIQNAFRQRTKKVFIFDSGALLTAVTSAATSPVTRTGSSAVTLLSTVTSASMVSSATETPVVAPVISTAGPLPSGSDARGHGVSLGHEGNSDDLQIVSVRSLNQLTAQTSIVDVLKGNYDIISTKGTTQEINENVQSGGQVSCQKSMEGAEVFEIEGPLQ